MEWLSSFIQDLQASGPALWHGFSITLKVVITATIGGVFIGTLLALMRLSSIKAFNIFAKGYVNLFRSIPLLLVLMWFYFAVPFIYTGITGNYLTIDTALVSSIVAFMLFEAAYFSEIVRAGIQSIPKGQTSAAYALGMSYSQAMRLIILPQSFRKMTPLLLQQTIILFQDSTMVYAIGLLDFFRTNYVRGDLMSLLTQYILFAGLVYFTISMIATYAVKKLQRRLSV
ncbi:MULTISPECIES: ABC transporter permease subunit [Acinetobacter]|jgi:amine acid ABC transporter, permease protein, 3-TM region, His/Glu/Gln/Arg/opine family|uniref:Glutamate/aspartate import permease protein GltK n=1 Tax=Acinetobacter amyesii TaxID=2942470 RepID=A0A1T1GSF2_9GAMM|nr:MULTISPECIES: ABC transporter permease subunit [Acinetobacter]MCL6235593.1 ABC transporter permease subunit [Acinetobacter amyesii]MCL6244842.1 ABC transporter permease subunit [Acinetobacter amyesii]MCL6246382.1 ABC transporter permease subunit [Acinetobacter amyesii]OOV80496.1 amino acid ABC transporter permease [Acinetobacter amyesii]OOV84221.1 amino acid ABC transporter permease [Acinetobacter sp. ANC 5600]